MTATQAKIERLCYLYKTSSEEIKNHVEERMKQDRTVKILTEEREKLKKRLIKLTARKGNFMNGIKTCKNCTNEYLEKENFNWSCRTHQSDWGGEMWWCCGKRGKDQPGCKYSKHESKDDEEEDEYGADKKAEASKILKYIRCVCCKEIGHSIDQCVRDPNIKTHEDLGSELNRIQKIKDFRKLHADTLVNTTHFIKKSVMVPLALDDEGKEVEPANVQHPFMRGIMNFDDYNYKQFNDFVLVEQPDSKI